MRKHKKKTLGHTYSIEHEQRLCQSRSLYICCRFFPACTATSSLLRDKIWISLLALSCRIVVQEAHKRILCFKRVQKANALIDNFVSDEPSCSYMVLCHQFWKCLHHIKWLCTLVVGYIVIITEITDSFLCVISNCGTIIIYVTFCMYINTWEGYVACRVIRDFKLQLAVHDCHHMAFLQDAALLLWSWLSCVLLCLVILLLINDELIA
jgi:hypothetical protein